MARCPMKLAGQLCGQAAEYIIHFKGIKETVAYCKTHHKHVLETIGDAVLQSAPGPHGLIALFKRK